MEKRLYKFYDISLPYPVSIRQIGFFIGTLVPWLFIMNFLGVPFKPPWNVIWVAPPFLAAWAANRPVAEGKTLFAYVWSQLSFFFSHREYSQLTPSTGMRAEDKEYVVTADVWRANRAHLAKVDRMVSGESGSSSDGGEGELGGNKKTRSRKTGGVFSGRRKDRKRKDAGEDKKKTRKSRGKRNGSKSSSR